MDFNRKLLRKPESILYNKNGPIKFDLHDLSSRYQFPLQVKEIKQNDQSVHLGKSHGQPIHTLLAIIHTKQIKCLSNNNRFTYLSPDQSEPVLTTPIERGVYLCTLLDVIENQKKQKISWVVVTRKFEVKNENYEVGELLEIKPPNLCKRLNCFLSTKQKHDYVTVLRHKTKTKYYLPSDIRGEFRQCQSPLSCYKVLCDLIAENEFPFIITLPEESYIQKRGDSPIWKKLIALELIGFSLVFLSDLNNDVIVQAIPDSVEINVEILNNQECHTNKAFNCIEFNDYKDILIENIAILERNPVRLKDLLPNSKMDLPFGSNSNSPNFNYHQETLSHVIGAIDKKEYSHKSTKEEILDDIHKKRGNSKYSSKNIPTSKVFNSVLKFEREINKEIVLSNSPPNDTDYEDMNATYTPTSIEEDSAFGENGYLQPIPNMEVPVYRARSYNAQKMKRPTIVKRAISDGEKTKTITVGVDGYVIVAPIPDEEESVCHAKCNTTKPPFLESRLTHVRGRFATSPPATRRTPPNKERHSKPLPLPKPPLNKFGEVSI